MGINLLGTIKLVAQIAGVAHEIGEYAAPVVDAFVRLRDKGPATAGGGEETVDEVRAKIDRALLLAGEIKQTGQAELDKLDRKDS